MQYYHIGTGVVHCRYILDQIPDDLGKGLVSSFHKLAGIEGIIK